MAKKATSKETPASKKEEKEVSKVSKKEAEAQVEHTKSVKEPKEAVVAAESEEVVKAPAAKKGAVSVPSVDELLMAGVHFGHQARRWHPKMQDYIFDKKQNIHIIDLYKTHDALQAACDFLYQIASQGGKVIFVGTKKQAKEIIELEAKRSGALYMADRWVGGALTNFQTIKKTIDKLKDLTKKKENNELGHYTKKERLLIDREISKLNLTVGGILPMTKVPDVMFVVDVRKEKTAVREAIKLGIPVVALVDTNSDPAGVNYLIPGNDDAIRSIALITKTVANAVEAGYTVYAKNQAAIEARLASEKLEAAEKAKAVVEKVEPKKEPVKEMTKEAVKEVAKEKPVEKQKAVEKEKPASKETADKPKRGRPKKQ